MMRTVIFSVLVLTFTTQIVVGQIAPNITTEATTVVPENTTTGVLRCEQHECQENGLFNEACCENTYCQCFNGQGVLRTCPNGQVFNEDIQSCDWVWQVPCCNASMIPPTTPGSEQCQAHQCDADGYFPEGGCEPDFCQCNGGQGHLLHCQDGLFYNPYTHVCDWPWNIPSCAITDNPTTSLPESCTTNCTQTNGMFGEGCCENTFCQCFGGEGYLDHCPEGSVFNEDVGICDSPDHVPCCQATTSFPPSNTTDAMTTTSKPITECSVDCQGHEDGPVAEGCCIPEYCVCDHGVGLPHACQNGTVFDDILNYCHNPNNVACCN